jgi:transcriptional regulator with XRE-family HTH domain
MSNYTTQNGAAFRAIRERSGLSVRDLVALLKQEEIEVHEDHIRNIETEARGASMKLLGACARVMKVPLPALLSARESVAGQPK